MMSFVKKKLLEKQIGGRKHCYMGKKLLQLDSKKQTFLVNKVVHGIMQHNVTEPQARGCGYKSIVPLLFIHVFTMLS